MAKAKTLLTDIYNITETVDEIQKKYMDDIDSNTLAMGMFGYQNEMFSTILQDAIICAAETGNESFPTRAKFERDVLTYAVNYDVQHINAVPATMNVVIGILEKELLKKFKNDLFTIYRDCPIYIGKYEFHLDYNMVIQKSETPTGDIVYSAMYDFSTPNRLSNITNPYLSAPYIANVNSDKFVFINCTLSQVTYEDTYKNILSSDVIYNKTIDFTVENQLADFDVIVSQNGEKTTLTPIFEGQSSDAADNYCYYTYIDTNKIRIKFDRNNFEPKSGAEVHIAAVTTEGADGIFEYNSTVLQALKSSYTNYNSLYIYVQPLESSIGGSDRKSMDELKQIIPRQILSRGNITNNKDIENYFNTLENNRLIFYKRRDNQITRLYYAYLLVKDESNNIIPTNTINLRLTPGLVAKDTGEFDNYLEKRYMLNPGRMIRYVGNDLCRLANPKAYATDDLIYAAEEEGFLYACPYLCVVNKAPLSVSYYLTIINRKYNFRYSYINNASKNQFITSTLLCSKPYVDEEYYTFSMTLTQNTNMDQKLVKIDDDGNIIDCKIRPFIIFKNDEGYSYYIEGNIVGYEKNTFKYNVEFKLHTTNILDRTNLMKFDNIHVGGDGSLSFVYFPDTVSAKVVTYVESDTILEKDSNRLAMDTIIPNMDDYNLTNEYQCVSDIHLFYNYSNVINSTITLEENTTVGGYDYVINGIPVVRYSYLNDLNRSLEFIDYIQYRKAFIDDALDVVEDSFSIDFKLFNTYGPSKMFKIGHDDTTLDRVNLKLKFKLKLKVGANKSTPDLIVNSIKSYVENINVIDSIHMTNLTTEITDEYSDDIEFIEFVSINNYDALRQYLEKVETDVITDVPEFLCINLTQDLQPDIEIELL